LMDWGIVFGVVIGVRTGTPLKPGLESTGGEAPSIRGWRNFPECR